MKTTAKNATKAGKTVIQAHITESTYLVEMDVSLARSRPLDSSTGKE